MENFFLNSILKLNDTGPILTVLIIIAFLFGLKSMWVFMKNIPTKEELSDLVRKLELVGNNLSISVNELRKEIKENRDEVHREISKINESVSYTSQEVRYIKGVMGK